MEFWSTGLGKRSMVISVGKETVKVSGNDVIMTGTVSPPLSWHYTITMDKDDWIEFLETAFHPAIISYLIKPGKRYVMFKAGTNLFFFFTKYFFYICVGVFRSRNNNG
jgi:hypothetical protein